MRAPIYRARKIQRILRCRNDWRRRLKLPGQRFLLVVVVFGRYITIIAEIGKLVSFGLSGIIVISVSLCLTGPELDATLLGGNDSR
jgi:hypothetical protein